MYDPISSPNDPAFMFHHNNMVRYFYAWMERHREQESNYYGYPRSEHMGGEGYCQPHLLDGIMGAWPFDDLVDDKPEGLTPRDVFERYGLDTAPYRFDTLR